MKDARSLRARGSGVERVRGAGVGEDDPCRAGSGGGWRAFGKQSRRGDIIKRARHI